MADMNAAAAAATPTSTTRYVGDTGPPIELELSDQNGYLTTLQTDATSLLLLAVNQTNPADTFTGACVVIDPPTADADGVHHWNAQYPLAAGDTNGAGTFDLFVTVTWSDGTEQTFAAATLTIKDKK